MWNENPLFEFSYPVSEFSADQADLLPQNEFELPTPMSIIDHPKNTKILDQNFHHTNPSYLSKESGDHSNLYLPASPGESQFVNDLSEVIKNEESDITGGKFIEDENFGKSNMFHDVSQTKHEQNAVESYLGLIPLINTINTSNYSDLLVRTLRQCSPQVPLDDFYNLIMDNIMLEQHSLEHTETSNNQALIAKNEGLILCSYVLETFRDPSIPVGKFSVGLVDNPQLFKINFEQFRRVFLAIKIISDSFVKVKDPSNISVSISRQSIMDGYTFLCDRLLKLYPMKSKYLFISRNLKLGSSCFGRILRIVYPDITVRRLGKRGSSRYHYIGLVWNKPFFESNNFPLLENSPTLSQTEPKAIYCLASEHITKAQKKSDSKLQEKPSIYKGYSFSSINPLRKYPQNNCLPRVWQFLPGQIPQKSKWANEMIYQSVFSLKKMNLDLEWLIQDFQQLLFTSDQNNNICTVFERTITQLWNQSSPEDSYLHLYNVILLSTFPVCLASNDEISVEDKYKLRENLKNLIDRLEKMHSSGMANSNHLLNFTNLIRKMTHLLDLTSTKVKTTMVDKITKECFWDLNKPAILPKKSIGITTETDEVIFSSVFVALKAMGSKDFKEIFRENANSGDCIPTEIAKEFANCFKFFSESILQIPITMTSEELSREFYELHFCLFKINLSLIHHLLLAQPLILRLPISVIRNIIMAIYKEVQNISFRGFGRREQELAKEIFKLWWVSSTSIEEYITILSEIVALSECLSFIQKEKR